MVIAAAALGSIAAGGLLAYLGNQDRIRQLKQLNKEQQDQIQAIIDKIDSQWQTPEYDQTPLTQEEYKVLETFVPEAAQFVQEQAPQLITEAGAQDVKRVEREALQSLVDQTKVGETAQGRAQREMGAMQAEQVGARMRQQALDELARSGQLVGGERLVMESAASGEAAQRAREASLQAAAADEQRRMQALGQVGSLAGQIRQQEMSKERSNVDIANSFNQRLSMRRQAHLDTITQQRNQANLMNQQARQQVANQNVALKNAMRQYERQRADTIAREKAQMANQKLQAQAGLMGQKPGSVQDDTFSRVAGTVGEKLVETGVKTGINALGDE
jgi:hypothetical protein